MAIVKTIKKGESLSFGFAFPDTYDITRLQNVKVYIGSSVYTHSMDGQKIRVVLRSNDTKLLTGTNVINLLVDDSVFGIRKVDYGSLQILPTQAVFSDESFNAGYDFLIPLIITENTISVENVLYSVIKGDKGDAGTIEVGTVETGEAGTEVIIENVGTPSEAILNFKIPKGDAGDFFQGTYNTVIDKLNLVWVDGWVHIDTGTVLNPYPSIGQKRIDVGYIAINTGQGTVQLKPIVHYPSSLTYEISSIPTGFYVKDTDNLLSENVDFESLDIRYNIEDEDGVYKYDGTAFNYGHNAIIDESSGEAGHSASGVKAFKAVYPDFEGEIIESVLDPLTNYSSAEPYYTPTYCKIKKANILSRPYSVGATTENQGSNPDILAIASHYGNSFSRYNITPNDTTFLKNVIAIGSCQATGIPVTGTSYGYGMEFSEVGNNLGLNAAYPDVTFDHVIGYGTGAGNTFTDSVGTRNYSNILELSVGTKIKLGLTLETSAEYTIATLGGTTFTTVETLTLEAGVNYVWITAHIGTVWQHVADNQSYYQSPVTSIIMAKFRKIQDLSGANWHICRLAARATASNGGVWDMYRGFGIINVDAAVQYIEDNYKSLEYRAMLADQHDGLNGISPFITYDDLLPNSPISKALAEGQFVAKEIGKSLIDDTEIAKLSEYPELTGVATDGFVNAAGELEQIAAAVGGFANNLYFSPTNSNVAGYKTLTYDLPVAETVVSQAVLSSDGDLLVASHLFADAVAADIFPAGLWSFEFYGRVSSISGVGSTQIGVRYFRYTSLGAKVYLFPTIVWSNTITNTVNNWIPIVVQQPSFVVEAGDRMGCDIYVKTSAATSRTVYYILGDGYASYLNNPNAVRHRILRAKNEELAYQHLDATQSKTTPIDADSVGLWDSVTSIFKRITWANIKAALKAFFDPIYEPLQAVTSYVRRVTADGGTIGNLVELTKLHLNNLVLLLNTDFLWSGDAGMKTRTSGVNLFASKIYNLANTNDAVQATEASQPHIGGTIAPSEVRKLKGLTGETGTKGFTGTNIAKLATASWSIAIMLKWNYPRTSSRIYLSSTNYILLTPTTITLVGDAVNVLVCTNTLAAGINNLIQFEYSNGAGLIRVNGIEIATTVLSGAVTFGSLLLDQTSYNFDGEIHYLQIFNKRLSAIEAQANYTLWRNRIPKIEGIAIGNQFWTTDNAALGVDNGNVAIPEVQDNAAWAALATPAWCYYNNNPLNGAVYGKLYNWWATANLAPAGYRVPTSADFAQLSNYLGGTAVAGGNMKKEGLTYWFTPNTGATNESGLSAIGAGSRGNTGAFADERTFSRFWCSDSASTSNAYWVQLRFDQSAFLLTNIQKIRGENVRFIRNEPVGDNERTVETGYITNALGATNLDISIPFGYQVESIRFDSETNITGLSAKLLTGALVELETLFTAKAITANVQKIIAADADQSIQQTDAVVRINGTKADTTKRFRVWVKLTKVVFS